MTEFGFCYSFNILKPQKIFNIEKVSNDFDFKFMLSGFEKRKIVEDGNEVKKVFTTEMGLEGYASWEVLENGRRFNEEIVNMDIDGILLLLHDPFELPSSSSMKIPMIANRTIQIWIEPELHNVDENLIDFSSQELSFLIF